MKTVYLVIQHYHDTQGRVRVFSVRTQRTDALADKAKAEADKDSYLSWVELVETVLK